MIALGADHGGFLLKEAIKAYLEQENIAYHDFGTYSEDSVDYAPIAEQVAHAVANGEAEKRHSLLRYRNRHFHCSQ